ncbi:MAG TPA: CHASE2 domain-containing protein [Pyrinomonadaceae bacterium]|jgi:CHASE2 domain-containing sensor protein|nr:CHASE2 domain-containing protein [Pyrinomonadaceae bacterium]
MKDSNRNIRNYVLLSIGITLVLTGAKILIEQTPIGLKLELLTFETLQSVLSNFNPNETLPVVVVDISEIQGSGEQVIDLDKLKDVLDDVIDKGPRAIAIDVVLTPEDEDFEKPGQKKENKAEAFKKYFDFLDHCVQKKKEKDVPIFVSVGYRSIEGPAEWLRGIQYRELAATTIIRRTDTSRIPIWIKGDSQEDKLSSISELLASAYTTPRLPKGISWVIEKTEDDLPGTQTQLGEGMEYAYAPVNYSKLEAIRETRISTAGGDSVKESGNKLRYKMVIIGDGVLEKAVDPYTVPGRSESVPGVYLHASAAYTFAREQMYEFNFGARIILDFILSFIVFGGVALVRYKRLADASDAPVKNWQSWLFYSVEGAILVLAFLFAYWLGLLWLDFMLVAIVLALHPFVEGLVLRVFVKTGKLKLESVD